MLEDERADSWIITNEGAEMFIPEWVLWTFGVLLLLGGKHGRDHAVLFSVVWLVSSMLLNLEWVNLGAKALQAAAWLLVYVGGPWIGLGLAGHLALWGFKKLGKQPPGVVTRMANLLPDEQPKAA